MNRIKTLFILVSLVAAAGLSYTILAIKNFPEVFDWDLDDEEENEF